MLDDQQESTNCYGEGYVGSQGQESCASLGGVCKTNPCSNYSNYTNLNDYCLSENCCLGLCNSTRLGNQQCIHPQVDKQPCNGKIDTQGLIDYINEWKNSQGVTITQVLPQVLQAVNLLDSQG